MTRPWTIHQGDCRVVMRDMDENSVDATVTDTPYGLSTVLDPPRLTQEAAWRKIMEGRAERARPLQEYLTEALDAFMAEHGRGPAANETIALLTAAMETRRNLGSPFDRLLGEWLDTGENPRLRGRGFMGNEWDCLVPPPNTWRAVYRVQKPGSYLFAFAGARTHGLIDTAIRLADFEVDDEFCLWGFGQGMPKRVRLDLKIDQHFGKAGERPVVGPSRHLGPPGGYGSEWKTANNQGETGAATPEAARFVGWDRARRPAFEPIIVATKPLAGTIAENALLHGTGGLHVDACRIERADAGATVSNTGSDSTRAIYGKYAPRPYQPIVIDTRGGYPSNLILDEEAAAELDASVAKRRYGGNAPASGPTFEGPNESIAHGRRNGMNGRAPAFHGEVDGPSRFFYVAKAPTSERDKGLEAMAVMSPGERSGREDGSAGINGYAGTRAEARNPGPCVKPINLLRPLVRMASPPGAWDPDPAKRPVVLDCFTGTGSTGVASMVEGVRFVGIEMMANYAEVARCRLQHAYVLPREEAPASDEEGERETYEVQRTLW